MTLVHRIIPEPMFTFSYVSLQSFRRETSQKAGEQGTGSSDSSAAQSPSEHCWLSGGADPSGSIPQLTDGEYQAQPSAI